MAVRWYSTVIDAHDPQSLARWWADALGWQVVHDTAEEAVIVPAHASEELVRSTPWEQVPPGLVFVAVPDDKATKNRVHLDLAPHTSDDRDAEIARLLGIGATRVDVGQDAGASWDVFADPEGNEFCILSSRDT
jgi:hypothetical protein